MRIAIVTDFYYPSLGGITEHVDGQARTLTAMGHDVTVVTGKLLVTPPVADDDQSVPEPTLFPSTPRAVRCMNGSMISKGKPCGYSGSGCGLTMPISSQCPIAVSLPF